METRRWTNPHQPQTLQIAVFLLYINAVFAVLFGGIGTIYGLVIIIGGAGAGYGIANEQRWGYYLGVTVAFVPIVLRILILGVGEAFTVDPLSLLFEIALIALLIHPQSREYERIWFK
jgi:hypothetical protein